MPGTTGDIKWTWGPEDPKTVTLTNTPQDDKEFGQATAMIAGGMAPDKAMEYIRSMSGSSLSQAELENFGAGMDMRERQRDIAKSLVTKNDDQSMWRTNRKALRSDNKYDRISAFSDMMTLGHVWIDDNGDVWSRYSTTPKMKQLLTDTSREWSETWRLREQGADPDDLAADAGREYSKMYFKLKKAGEPVE